MKSYSVVELQAAHRALASSIRKIEKVRETLLGKPIPPKSQITLAERNLNALRLSVDLIMHELEHSQNEQTGDKAK
jgi:hypothetical protein